MKRIEVYFVRHGETYFNRMHKMQGWADSPLTETGIECLKVTGQKLRRIQFDNVYSSDLKRAVDTANIIQTENQYSERPIIQLPQFRELFFGSFEGLNNVETWRRIGQPYGCNNQQALIEKYSIDKVRSIMKQTDERHLAEDAAEFWQRFEIGCQIVLSQNEDGATVLIVTHGTLLKMMALRYFYQTISLAEAFPDNGSVSKVWLTQKSLELITYNLTEHVD